jgi:hypothetical protein
MNRSTYEARWLLVPVFTLSLAVAIAGVVFG